MNISDIPIAVILKSRYELLNQSISFLKSTDCEKVWDYSKGHISVREALRDSKRELRTDCEKVWDYSKGHISVREALRDSKRELRKVMREIKKL
jgi:hypothetical protein